MNYEYEESYWETKNHEKIKISDMTDLYIINTINFLKKNPHFYDEYYNFEYCDYDDFETGEVLDNSELVYKKIEELEKEFRKREFKELYFKDSYLYLIEKRCE